MERKAPPWFDKPYGRDALAWAEARSQCRSILVTWARRGRYGTYSELVDQVPAIAWPEGAYTHHGAQVGYLLGQVGVGEWCAERPLLSAMAVQRAEGIPSKGFFDMARDIGELAGSDPDTELRFWLKEFEACCAFPWTDR